MNRVDPRLDPDQLYGSDGGRLVEHNAARVLDHFPGATSSRTRDAIQIDIHTDPDGDHGVTVLVTPEAYEVRLPTIEWTAGAYGPARSSRYLTRIDADDLDDDALKEHLDHAIAVRDAEFVPCRICGQRTPTEHRHDDVCHACAERHLGIAH